MDTGVELNSESDGLFLTGSILALDATSHGSISFLSSAAQATRTPKMQIICTDETSKILEILDKKPNALLCQYNRPITLGDMKLELLPSGTLLGGASLFIESPKLGRLLYAPLLQTKHLPLIRKFQLKKADSLVIGAYQAPLAGATPSRKKELAKLIGEIKTLCADGQRAVVVCNPYATAQELTKLFVEEELTVFVHRQIHAINRIYNQYGSALGPYKLFSFSQKQPGVVLLPPQVWLKAIKSGKLSSANTYSVEDALNPIKVNLKLAAVAKRYNVSSICSASELKEVVTAVQPKKVYIFGPYAKALADELKDKKYKVKPLYSNFQPTLF